MSGWLQANTGLSERTARRYMQLARSGLKTATVAEMGLRAATESLAAWPLPEPGMVLMVKSTRPEEDLTSFVWAGTDPDLFRTITIGNASSPPGLTPTYVTDVSDPQVLPEGRVAAQARPQQRLNF